MNRPSAISRDASGIQPTLLPFDSGTPCLLARKKLAPTAFQAATCLRGGQYVRRGWILFPHYWRTVP